MNLYFDANVFIFASLIDEGDVRVRRAQELMRKVSQGGGGYTSVLAVDEVVWAWIRQKKDRATAIQQGLRIHTLPNLRVLEVTSADSLKSLSLLQRFPHLKPRDAIHAAVCFSNGISSIVSDDPDFDRIEGLKRIPLD
ncbi:type II toxin-antitoxin system VapC family toxin [Candidatus Woesearchaeota archaeon]|nr:type II toxin-antitoxin system VapC family toxin [Candidatus Woesearchaeota archaeon]